jgi:acetyltransferase-like isoleucine patch superfamily enzyme
VKKFFLIVVAFLPSRIKVFFYRKIFHWDVHPSVKIGFSFIMADFVVMKKGASIGHLNIIKGIKTLNIGEFSSIASINWITGFPIKESEHFKHLPDRHPSLIVGDNSAITSRHLIDCTSSVFIGNFTTFAGYRSQILTHAIDIYKCRQDSKSVSIGDYCFVGTGVILLPGSSLPDYSVMAAGAVLNKSFSQEGCIYAGVPAKAVKLLDKDSTGYMTRIDGYVW